MIRKSSRLAWTLVGLGLGAAFAAHAQSRPVSLRAGSAMVDARWKESFDGFAAADRERAPQAGGVLFVGSSSIRLWDDLESSFSGEPVVIKRGFGGSRLSDCVTYLDRLVLPYAPRLVVLYAGDNDLAEGATAEEVAASFQAFVDGVRASLPGTRIAYMSIKPSPLRATLMEDARRANALIADAVRAGDNLDFIDVYSKMLGPDGAPRADLYGPDRLHLNADGYALWRATLVDHLQSPPAAPAPGAARMAAAGPSGS